jgi:uncharacterized repeat protein (TIGR01451 family)
MSYPPNFRRLSATIRALTFPNFEQSITRQLAALFIAAFILIQPMVLMAQRGKAAQKAIPISEGITPANPDTGTGSVSLTTVGSPVTENFDTLSNTAGSTTNTALPTGWYITETGGGARDNEQYAVDTGGSTTGDIYSYGSAAATDRALGELRSGTLIPLFGAKYTNNTGTTITSLGVSYTGEQWRFGGVHSTVADRLDFQYSVNATDLSTGTYLDANALDFNPPVTAGTAGALDGNAAANRTAISSTITGLSIPNGATFFIRLNDVDATGADDGLAIDNFSLTPNPGGAVTPTLNINDVTQAEGDAGTTNFNFTVSLSVPAQTGGVSFTVNTANGTTNPATAGSDYVAITNGAGSIPEGSSSTQVTVQVNGDTTTEANETFFVNISAITGATAGDVQGLGTITNDDVTLTPIHDIQGAGSTSPLVGQNVTTRGVVTGIKAGSSGGFFIQEPDATVDANPNTSEGVFVFTGASLPPAAVIGNLAQVNGNVQEFIPSADLQQKPQTELSGTITASVISTGNSLPTPATIAAADTQVNNLDNLERFEGMRVTIPSLTVVAPTQGTITEPSATVSSNGVFYGVVTGVARPFREPGVNASDTLPAGSPANVPRFDENPERLRIDSDAQPGTTALNVSAGSVITNVTGPLEYGFRTYTIDPDTTLTATSVGPTAAPTPTATEFTVASFNMERFFDTVNDPDKDDAVLTQAALDKRLNKASLIIRNIQRYPDVIGVEEMENLSTLQMVAAKVNSDAQTIDALPNPNYVAYLVEGNDIGGIDVGFLVKESRITTVDVTQVELAGCNHITGAGCNTYTNPNTGGQELLNDRPSLVLRATVPRPAIYGGGALPFTVIVNHLRSLSSIDDDVTPNGTGTAGSRVRAKRKAQADFLANYIQSRQTNDPNEKIITVGDMNAFRINDGYVDMIGTILGTPSPDDQTVVPGDGADLVNPNQTDLVDTLAPAEQYSYSFDGNAQTLDHVIVNPNALAIVSRFAYAREDADQPVKDYEDGNIPDRISDHDQPIAYLSLAPTVPDVGISMTADRNPALVGFNFNYNITVTNIGAMATGVEVTDTLPSQVTLTAMLTSQGTCSFDPTLRKVTCSLGTVNAGSPVNIRLTVKPRSEGTLNNTADVTLDELDSNPGNNSASVNGLPSIKIVDLATSMTESADPIFNGENETYTLSVTNINTPISATGVVLTDTLPGSLTFVSATTSQGSLITPPVGSNGVVTANLGTIAPGATVTVTITTKSTASGNVTNSATASSNESDSDPTNNTASQTTTVKDALLQKVLLASQVLTGGCQNTTGNVYLTGPAPAGGLTVGLSSNITGASVPASVFIPAGQTVSPAFNVTTSPVAAKQVGLIIATLNQTTVSRGITINKGSGVCPP